LYRIANPCKSLNKSSNFANRRSESPTLANSQSPANHRNESQTPAKRLTESCLERLDNAEYEGGAPGDLLEHLGHFVVAAPHQALPIDLLNVIANLRQWRAIRGCGQSPVATVMVKREIMAFQTRLARNVALMLEPFQ
jgi:hypothetical protein